MAITLTTLGRDAACNGLTGDLQNGSTDASGDLVIMTSGDVTVATCVLSNPAFGAAVSGVCTANSITDDSSAVGGTAALHKFQNRDNQELWRGTVGTSGADLNLSSVTIGAGDTVSITAYTVTQPAS